MILLMNKENKFKHCYNLLFRRKATKALELYGHHMATITDQFLRSFEEGSRNINTEAFYFTVYLGSNYSEHIFGSYNNLKHMAFFDFVKTLIQLEQLEITRIDSSSDK